MEIVDRFVNIGINLRIREWRLKDADASSAFPFLLVHGLASNARTWDRVAAHLFAGGHTVVAVDQRGHGLSEKPSTGYDFETIVNDLRALVEALGFQQVVLVGQSWGGNVLLEFGARFPQVAMKFVFVDGGFLDLAARGPWEKTRVELAPPHLDGLPRALLKERISRMHPTWDDWAVEATLGNFESLVDGTVRPWLARSHHMEILKSMYDQQVQTLYPRVQEPVLICAADDGSEWAARKKEQVNTACEQLTHGKVKWFQNAAHDIHVDRPEALAAAIMDFVAED